MTKRKFHLLPAIVLILLAASCDLRPLEDPSELVNIRINVNVKTVINVTARHTLYTGNPKINELTAEKDYQLKTDIMRVLIYNPKTKSLVNQSFVTSKSEKEDGSQMFTGTLNISYGTFDFLVYNFDTPTTQVKDENNEDQILAYTNELTESQRSSMLGSKADTFDNIPIHLEPEHLMVAHHPEMRVSPHDTVVVIHTEASSIIDTYYIQIHVEGMQYASTRANAVISGVSPSNHIGQGTTGGGVRTTDPAGAVCFELRQSTDTTYAGANKDIMCAVFNTFGKIPDAKSDLRVTFNVVDIAGNLQQKEVNLDEIFKTEDAVERHWLLIDEVWTIEKPENPSTPGSGFQPWVTDWEITEGNISL
ncbi:MAG: DUF5119 domain-containing protein [Bacteroidales bacterium]|nr:DUF5119 domain-containing protein [Bacteroidales bacterium]